MERLQSRRNMDTLQDAACAAYQNALFQRQSRILEKGYGTLRPGKNIVQPGEQSISHGLSTVSKLSGPNNLSALLTLCHLGNVCRLAPWIELSLKILNITAALFFENDPKRTSFIDSGFSPSTCLTTCRRAWNWWSIPECLSLLS